MPYVGNEKQLLGEHVLLDKLLDVGGWRLVGLADVHDVVREPGGHVGTFLPHVVAVRPLPRERVLVHQFEDGVASHLGVLAVLEGVGAVFVRPHVELAVFQFCDFRAGIFPIGAVHLDLCVIHAADDFVFPFKIERLHEPHAVQVLVRHFLLRHRRAAPKGQHGHHEPRARFLQKICFHHVTPFLWLCSVLQN